MYLDLITFLMHVEKFIFIQIYVWILFLFENICTSLSDNKYINTSVFYKLNFITLFIPLFLQYLMFLQNLVFNGHKIKTVQWNNKLQGVEKTKLIWWSVCVYRYIYLSPKVNFILDADQELGLRSWLVEPIVHQLAGVVLYQQNIITNF